MASRARRIVLTGGESTGKTTLARAIAEHYGYPWVGEFAREYAIRVERPLTVADVEPIAVGQRAAEDEALANQPLGIVLDTDLLSTWVYALHYYGTAPAWLAEAVSARSHGLYLLCDIDLGWEADAVRDRSDRREQVQKAFRAELDDRGLVYEVVSGFGGARLAAALAAIERRAATP